MSEDDYDLYSDEFEAVSPAAQPAANNHDELSEDQEVALVMNQKQGNPSPNIDGDSDSEDRRIEMELQRDLQNGGGDVFQRRQSSLSDFSHLDDTQNMTDSRKGNKKSQQQPSDPLLQTTTTASYEDDFEQPTEPQKQPDKSKKRKSQDRPKSSGRRTSAAEEPFNHSEDIFNSRPTTSKGGQKGKRQSRDEGSPAIYERPSTSKGKLKKASEAEPLIESPTRPSTKESDAHDDLDKRVTAVPTRPTTASTRKKSKPATASPTYSDDDWSRPSTSKGLQSNRQESFSDDEFRPQKDKSSKQKRKSSSPSFPQESKQKNSKRKSSKDHDDQGEDELTKKKSNRKKSKDTSPLSDEKATKKISKNNNYSDDEFDHPENGSSPTVKSNKKKKKTTSAEERPPPPKPTPHESYSDDEFDSTLSKTNNKSITPISQEETTQPSSSKKSTKKKKKKAAEDPEASSTADTPKKASDVTATQSPSTKKATKKKKPVEDTKDPYSDDDFDTSTSAPPTNLNNSSQPPDDRPPLVEASSVPQLQESPSRNSSESSRQVAKEVSPSASTGKGQSRWKGSNGSPVTTSGNSTPRDAQRNGTGRIPPPTNSNNSSLQNTPRDIAKNPRLNASDNTQAQMQDAMSRIKTLEGLLEEATTEKNQYREELTRVKKSILSPEAPQTTPRKTDPTSALIRRSEIKDSEPNTVLVLRTKQGVVPSKRERHGSVVVGPNVFIWGGRGSTKSSDLDPALFAFNVRSAQWKKVACTGPKPYFGRHSHTCTMYSGDLPWSEAPPEDVPGTMVIVGGISHQLQANEFPEYSPRSMIRKEPSMSLNRGSSPMTYSKDLLFIDLESKRWNKISLETLVDPSLWLPDRVPCRDVTAVRNHTTVVYKHRLYIYGGVREPGSSSHIDCINLRRMKWVPLPHPENNNSWRPRGVQGHSAIVWNGSMWVYGGRNNDGDLVSEITAYNFSSGAWSQKPTGGEIPPARCGHGCSVISNFMFIHGGTTSPLEYSKDCYILNLSSLIWTRIQLITPPNYFGLQCHSLEVVVDPDLGQPRDFSTEGDIMKMVRGFVFGGGGDVENVAYSLNQYQSNNDICVLDFCGGWGHANLCSLSSPTSVRPASGSAMEAVIESRSQTAASRPLSVQLPMRYARSEPWRLEAGFDPVAPTHVSLEKKRLTQEEINNMANRLHSQTVQIRDERLKTLKNKLFKETPTRRLTKEEEEKAVNRLYTICLEQTKERQNRLAKRFVVQTTQGEKLDPQKLKESIERLHGQNRKASPKPFRAAEKEPKRLDKEETEEVNQKLYYKRLEIERQKRQNLLDKYTKDDKEMKCFRSAAEQKAVTDRLFNGKRVSIQAA